MKCDIDNIQFNPHRLIYRDQGFGTDPGVTLSPYSLAVTNEELLSAFAGPFDAFISQCRKDDESFSDSDMPDIRLLGYPSLEEMLAGHRSLLAGLIKDYLYFHILDAFFGRNLRSDWLFSINEISEVSVSNEGYILHGKGYFI